MGNKTCINCENYLNGKCDLYPNLKQNWTISTCDKFHKLSNSYIVNCLKCGKPMRVTKGINHWCRKCRQAKKFMDGKGYSNR